LKACGVMGREESLTRCYQPPALVKKRRRKRSCSEKELGLKILSIGASHDGMKPSHISTIVWSVAGNRQRKSIIESGPRQAS
jgi:hypothetical protein